jgi:hypothetical protein
MAKLTSQQRRDKLAQSISLAVQPYLTAYLAKDIKILPVPATVEELETISIDNDRYGMHMGVKFRYSKGFVHDPKLGPVADHKLLATCKDFTEIFKIAPLDDVEAYNSAVDIANTVWSRHVKLQKRINEAEA